jgi:hypothetical protein
MARETANLFDLGEEGKKALIEAYKKATTEDERRTILQAIAWEKRRGGDGALDRTTFLKRVVFSVAKDPSVRSPADRIDRVRVDLRASPGWRFDSWNRFSTEYGTVDLGTVKLTRSDEFTASLDVTPPGESALDGALGFTGRRAFEEGLTLNRRFVAITGALAADRRSATLSQEGNFRIDLVGNFAVDLTVRADASARVRVARCTLRDASGKDLPAAQAVVRMADALLPAAPAPPGSDPCPPLRASVSGSYRLRHVVSGDDTEIEGDDDVFFLDGPLGGGQQVDLVSRDEVEARRSVWSVGRVTGGVVDEVLHADLAEGRRPLLFASHDEARDFVAWLRSARATSLGTAPLVWSDGTAITADQAAAVGLERDRPCGPR